MDWCSSASARRRLISTAPCRRRGVPTALDEFQITGKKCLRETTILLPFHPAARSFYSFTECYPKGINQKVFETGSYP